MEYRYPPLYKYIVFLLILFLFLKHYKYITQDKYLIISILATLLIVLLDYMLIFDHPNILEIKERFDCDDLDDIIEDNDINDINYTNNKRNIIKHHCKKCTGSNMNSMIADDTEYVSNIEMKNMDIEDVQNQYPMLNQYY